jgi:hypothetical protein
VYSEQTVVAALKESQKDETDTWMAKKGIHQRTRAQSEDEVESL